MSKPVTTVTAPVKPVVTYRQVAGTRVQPATSYRALRQAKGYGRVALASALGITTSALWAIEVAVPSSPSAMAALKALPNVGKASGQVPAAGLPGAPRQIAPKGRKAVDPA